MGILPFLVNEKFGLFETIYVDVVLSPIVERKLKIKNIESWLTLNVI